MQGFKNRRYEYEEKFVLGSGDSHSDSRTDGGTDRTGNNVVHGLRPILKSHDMGLVPVMYRCTFS